MNNKFEENDELDNSSLNNVQEYKKQNNTQRNQKNKHDRFDYTQKQSFKNGNIKYNYKPNKQQDAPQKIENNKKSLFEPVEYKESKLLIPVLAILSVVILSIVMLQSLQTNKLMAQYADVVSKYETAMTQNGAVLKSVSESMAKIADKQPIYITTPNDAQQAQPSQPTENTDPTPSTPEENVEPAFDNSAFLGVTVDEETMGANPLGVKIASVVDYSAASFGGLQANDIIMTFDGKAVTNMNELSAAISEHIADDEVVIEFARVEDGDVVFKNITVALSARGNFALDD